MVDSQWPAYAVFEETKEGAAHTYAGSVHAPDSEIAIQNARDVFSRRPRQFSLWVVPEEVILKKTAHELYDGVDEHAESAERSQAAEPYYVFEKIDPRGPCTFVACVEARSPAHALALFTSADTGASPSWRWALPKRAVTKTQPHERQMLFDSVLDKTFRNASEYPVDRIMRRLKEASNNKQDESDQ